MKRLIAGALAFLFSAVAAATTLNPVQLLNPAGSTSGQAIVSTGATTAPGWASIVNSVIAGSGVTVSGATGNVTLGLAANGVALSNLAQVAANTVLGNATGSTANVTAITVTGCNGAAQALQWTNASGFGCNSSIATSGANANITSLSGLTTALSVAQGGTGRATLTTHGVLVGEGTAAINQLAVGTTGQVLVGATGADPAFGTSVAGLTFTSAATPQTTGGLVGTTLGDNASAGSWGEYATATNTALSLTNNVAANCTSVSLTAGDWDVTGTASFNAAATTTVQALDVGVSTTSATIGGLGTTNKYILTFTTGAASDVLSAPIVRVSVSTTTTVYLVGVASFGTSTMTCDGFIRARRVR